MPPRPKEITIMPATNGWIAHVGEYTYVFSKKDEVLEFLDNQLKWHVWLWGKLNEEEKRLGDYANRLIKEEDDE